MMVVITYMILRKKIRDTAHRINGFAGSVDNLLRKGVSNDSIPNFAEDVNEKFSERGGEYSKPITTNDVKVLREITKAHNGERVSINDFTSADIKKTQKWAYKFYKELGTKSPFFRAWFGDYRQYEDNPETDAIVIRYGYSEHLPINTAPRTIKNDDTGFEINIDNDIVGDSLHYGDLSAFANISLKCKRTD